MKDKNENKTNERVAGIASATSGAISMLGTALKAVGETLPPPLKATGKLSNIIKEAAKDPTPGLVERGVCATASVLAKGAASAPFVAEAGARGAAAVKSKHPYALVAGAVGGVAIAAPAINAAVKPVGDAASAACHAAFDRFNGRSKEAPAAKEQQKKQALNQVVDTTSRYNSANLHAQRQAYQQVMSNTQCFNLPFTYRQHSPALGLHSVWRAQQQAISEFRIKYGTVPTWVEIQIVSQVSSWASVYSSSYNGISSSMAEFALSVMASGVVSSYNAYNIGSRLYSPSGSYGDIGGVATQVSTITDLINSEAHAAADVYYLCFLEERLPFFRSMLDQIALNLDQANRFYKTSPFFNLGFNQYGLVCPDIHPAFQNTLVGEVIGFLDYWLKCYLNGGFYDIQFLRGWTETTIYDENDLKTKVKDLKKYFQEHLPTSSYFSVREIESRYGLKDQPSHTAYKQPFMTSFRIIAYQIKIERQDNILIPQADIKVEYSIDMMPDYKLYVDNYLKEHGQLPPEYERLRHCYELFADEIKENMPKLPFCKDFFNLLGAMSSFGYVQSTLEKMGKRQVFADSTITKITPFPKALPPIPVRYYRSYDLPIKLQDILQPLSNTEEKAKALDQLLAMLFASQEPDITTLKPSIEDIIRSMVNKTLATQLPAEAYLELNNEDIDRIVNKTCQTLASYVSYFSENLGADLFNNGILKLDIEEQGLIMEMPLAKKLPTLQICLDEQIKVLQDRWQTVSESDKTESLQDLWLETEGIVNEAIEIYQAKILGIKANKEDELSKQTPGQKISNAVNIAIFEKNMDDEIAAIQESIKSLQMLISAFESPNNSFLEQITSWATDFKLNAFYKSALLEAVQQVHEFQKNQLASYVDLIQNFSKKLLGIKPIAEQSISEKYTHAFLGFTGKAPEDKFHFIGGCGVESPDLVTQPIPHAEVFCSKMTASMSRSGQEKGRFEHDGNTYVVYPIPVCDLDDESEMELSQQDKALQALAEVNREQVSAESLSPEQLSIEVDDSGATLMHHAAASLNVDQFTKVLKSAPNAVEQPDDFGNLPLHCAAQSGNLDAIIKILESFPKQLDAQNKRGQTPLMLAVQNGQQSVMEYLQAKNADFNYSLPNGLTPLYMAIQKNFTPLALWMLDHVKNLDINKALFSQMTALHLAIQCGSITLAMKLVEKNAHCDIRRKSDGFAAIHCAAQQGDAALIKSMLAKVALANLPLESQKTPLHLAAEAGHLEAVQILISSGALVNAKDLDGETALTLAIKAGQIETALWLADKTAVNTVNLQQQTASLLALQYAMPQVGDRLIARGENPQALDKKGESYLYYLLRNGEYQRFKQLANKQQINLRQEIHGQNLLALAAQNGHFLIVYDLLDRGFTWKSSSKLSLMDYAVMADEIGYLRDNYSSDMNLKALSLIAVNSKASSCLKWLLHHLPAKDCQSSQLLQAAIEGNDESIMTQVLKHCKDINIILDKDGNTPLLLAVKKGSHHALSLLADRGCQFSKRNQHQQSAFHLAVIQDDADLLKRLLRLSHPNHWPRDLWEANTRSVDSKIAKLLIKYEKRLPALTGGVSAKTSQPTLNASKSQAKLPPSPLLSEEQKAALKALQNALDQSQFDKAMIMLQRRAFLLHIFKTDQGGALFKRIFDNMIDFEGLEAGSKQRNRDSSADRLLVFLKAKGIRPQSYTDKDNVLLALIRSEDEKLACYRLNVLTKHFPESLVTLSQDKLSGKTSMTRVALIGKQYALFKQLDDYCRRQKEGQNGVYNGLHEVIEANLYGLVVSLLENYAVNSANHLGQTALMLAASEGNLSIINLLLQHGACVDQLDNQGRNALHYAIKASSKEAALALLPLLKNPNQADRFEITPLMAAAAKGLVPILRFLCESDQEMSQVVDNQGFNALHYAAMAGKVESISWLVAQGFAIDQPESPLKPSKIARSKKRTALQLATLGGHEEAVFRLLSLGANPEQEDARGFAFCEYAVLSNDIDMLNLVKLLPYYNNKERNQQLLHAAAIVDQIDVLSELILDEANLNTLNSAGRSALHLCCIFDSGKAAKLLLKGGDLILDGFDKQGYAPLHYAAKFGHVNLIALLGTAGVDINQLNVKGNSPMGIAAAKGKCAAVVALLRQKADFTKVNQQGLTPAQAALLKGYPYIAKILQVAGDTSLQPSGFSHLPEKEKRQLTSLLVSFNKQYPKNSTALARLGFYQQPKSDNSADVLYNNTPEKKG